VSATAYASRTVVEAARPRRHVVITALGSAQILAWGSSYYLPAVLAKPIATATGWPLTWIVGGLSIGLLVAGLVSPRVGDTIERHGGRPVLAASSGLLALGLVGLALAPNLPTYLASAAFATLGRLYGHEARVAIATLTLFGGFASTACWPLSAALVSEFGWRGACLFYAALHLLVVLPLYAFLLPREARHSEVALPLRHAGLRATVGPSRLLFLLLTAAITISSMISTMVSVHLLTILQTRDIALAAAVALGALVGPSQVGARAVEMMISRYHHPIWTLLAATVFVAVGVGVLWAGWPVVSAALVFYGAGIGIESIARGTLPLAIFGRTGYAAIMGRIAMPTLIAQAASPSLGALLLAKLGAQGTLAALLAAAILGVAAAAALLILLRSSPHHHAPQT
jgi:hypothetical protein